MLRVVGSERWTQERNKNTNKSTRKHEKSIKNHKQKRVEEELVLRVGRSERWMNREGWKREGLESREQINKSTTKPNTLLLCPLPRWRF